MSDDYTDPTFVLGAVLAQCENLTEGDAVAVLRQAIVARLGQRPDPPTMAGAVAAVEGFATAAELLLGQWGHHATPPEVDALLTRTYPGTAMPMSFDEVTAELWAWRDDVVAGASS